MIGHRSEQKNLWDADGQYLDFVGEDSFYGLVSPQRYELFCDDDFAELYCKDNGRPSGPMNEVVDTTSIWGRGAVQDTYNLIAEGIKQVCRALVQRDDEAPQLTEAAELLGKLLLQDVELTTDGYKIKRRTVNDRIPSVYDPEQRHGRKSPGNTFTGHKAEVAVDSETGVITNVNVNAGNASAGARKAEATDAPGETRGACCCRQPAPAGST